MCTEKYFVGMGLEIYHFRFKVNYLKMSMLIIFFVFFPFAGKQAHYSSSEHVNGVQKLVVRMI